MCFHALVFSEHISFLPRGGFGSSFLSTIPWPQWKKVKERCEGGFIGFRKSRQRCSENPTRLSLNYVITRRRSYWCICHGETSNLRRWTTKNAAAPSACFSVLPPCDIKSSQLYCQFLQYCARHTWWRASLLGHYSYSSTSSTLDWIAYVVHVASR